MLELFNDEDFVTNEKVQQSIKDFNIEIMAKELKKNTVGWITLVSYITNSK